MATTKTSSVAADTRDAVVPTTSALFNAVESLRNQMNDAYEGTLLGDGNFLKLRDELGEIRDRADQIQSAVMGFISSINEYL